MVVADWEVKLVISKRWSVNQERWSANEHFDCQVLTLALPLPPAGGGKCVRLDRDAHLIERRYRRSACTRDREKDKRSFSNIIKSIH